MNIYEQYLDFIIPNGNTELAITDAPKIYHEACFYLLIGTLIGRSRHVCFGINELYPNMWTVLLGASSDMHKSTAINIAEYFMRMIEGYNPILPNEFTSEALVEILSKQAQGIFIFSEYSQFLTSMEREYNFGLKSLITALYDSPPRYRRLTKKDDIELKDVCLSMLSASTPQWLQNTEENMEGGLMTRTFFVHAEHKDKTFKQYFPVAYDRDKFNALFAELMKIYRYPFPVDYKFDDEVKEIYRTCVDEIDEIITEVPQLRTLFARANIFLIKYSMIIQTIIDKESTEISGIAMLTSCEFVKRVIKRILPVFQLIPQSSKDKDIQRVLRIITNAGWVSRSVLLKESRLLAIDLNKIIETLIQSHSIIAEEQEGKGMYYFEPEVAVRRARQELAILKEQGKVK